MGYFKQILKVLLILLVVLALHTLVYWQIVQHLPKTDIIVQAPKPIMVSLITPPKPPPVVKLPPITQTKTVAKPKRKMTQRTKKVKRKRIAKKFKSKLAKKVKVKSKVKHKSKHKQPRKVAKSSRRRSKRAKIATRYQHSATTPTKIATHSLASRSYRVGQNGKKTGESKSKRKSQSQIKSSRKKARGITTAPSYKAAYLHNPRPAYPRISRRRGEQGKVLLRVKVATNGKATSVILTKSSGSNRLDNAARKTVYKWRFIPAKSKGKPVSGWVIVPIVFKLN